MHGFEARSEERLGEQHEDVVRTVSERDLFDLEAVPVRKLRAQPMTGAIRVVTDPGNRVRERRERMRSRAERIFVGCKT